MELMNMNKWRTEKESLYNMFNNATDKASIDMALYSIKAHEAKLEVLRQEEIEKYEQQKKKETLFQRFDRWVRG